MMSTAGQVSILVLMDLALELLNLPEYPEGYSSSFNPCFNGSCSRISQKPTAQKKLTSVSILVLMDLALELGSGVRFRIQVIVSILVLMDLALEFHISILRFDRRYSFNPCFNGSCSRIFPNLPRCCRLLSFQSLF